MSQSEIERFAADLKSDAALRAEAEKAQADTSSATPLQRTAAFAGSKGYAFTTGELKEHVKAKARAEGKELTDAELDSVSGGVGLAEADAMAAKQAYIDSQIAQVNANVDAALATPSVADEISDVQKKVTAFVDKARY